MKLDWSDLNLFLATARGGGLAAGARISGISAPTLGRHMVALERAIGAVLFKRLPRGYELTEAGQELFTEAEAVETQIIGIERRRDRGSRDMPVHISAGTWMIWFLTQNVGALGGDPTRLGFHTSESRHHLSRRKATIGLRNARPGESALAARKTTHVVFASYAAPSAAAREDWIAAIAQTPSANWVRSNKAQQIRHEAASPRSLLDLALQGAGHAVLPCFVGDRHPDLIRTGPIIKSLSHDQWLVVHGEERHQPAVRKVVNAIYKLFVSHRPAFEGTLSSEREQGTMNPRPSGGV